MQLCPSLSTKVLTPRLQPPSWLSFVLNALAFVTLPGLCGCHQIETPTTDELQSLLHPVEASQQSVTLEIFQLRFPGDNQGLVEDLWQQVDEQRLAIALRRDLVQNGFRAGILGGALPDALAEAMKLQSEIPENTPSRLLTGQTAQPMVTRRVLQLGQEEHAIIRASELRPQLNLLLCNENGLHGETYNKVEAAFEVQAQFIDGQQIALQLTPELHHGELRNRYTGGDQGVILMTPSREHEVYDHLKINTPLSPGELLVVGSLAEVPGSLGHTFHTVRQQGRLQHKLVLVRLLQVPPSQILASR